MCKSRPKILGGVLGVGLLYITPEKRGGYMTLEEMYLCACIWRTELN